MLLFFFCQITLFFYFVHSRKEIYLNNNFFFNRKSVSKKKKNQQYFFNLIIYTQKRKIIYQPNMREIVWKKIIIKTPKSITKPLNQRATAISHSFRLSGENPSPFPVFESTVSDSESGLIQNQSKATMASFPHPGSVTVCEINRDLSKQKLSPFLSILLLKLSNLWSFIRFS